MKPEFCLGFKVFPIQSFSPVAWYDSFQHFDPSKVNSILAKTKNSIAVHMSSSKTNKFKIEKSKRSAYKVLAEFNCPLVYAASGEIF